MKKLIFILFISLIYNNLCAQNKCTNLFYKNCELLVGDGIYLSDTLLTWNPSTNKTSLSKEITYILQKNVKYRFAIVNSEELQEPISFKIYTKDNRLVSYSIPLEYNYFIITMNKTGEYKVVLKNYNRIKCCTQLVLSIHKKSRPKQKKQFNFTKCDPELMEKKDSLVGNATYLKDFHIELNSPCEYKMYSIVLSKNTIYRWVIANSDKYKGKNQLKLFDEVKELDLIQIDENTYDFYCLKNDTYHLRIEKKDTKKSCSLVLLLYVDRIKKIR